MENKFSLENSNYVIEQNSSLEETMKAITVNHRGAVVVIDKTGHLIGIVSDGDIRRAILHGLILQTPISSIVNYNVSFFKENTLDLSKKIEKIFSENYNNLIPVVNDENVVVDLIIRGGAYERK